jgi:hypothetical protein
VKSPYQIDTVINVEARAWFVGKQHRRFGDQYLQTRGSRSTVISFIRRNRMKGHKRKPPSSETTQSRVLV